MVGWSDSELCRDICTKQMNLCSVFIRPILWVSGAGHHRDIRQQVGGPLPH